jgi:SAM-dependent methyltransferase
MTEISYHHVRDFPGWVKAPDFLRTLIGDYQPRILLEIGSGANPTLDLEAAQNSGLRYITSDSSEAELAKAPAGFEARLLHLEGDHFPDDLLGRCDMVFSRMVNEHVIQGKKYHQNILKLLAPGGIAVHCFSTLYALPFVVNDLLSAGASEWLFDFITGCRHHSKFPARYSWCRGPTVRMLKRFEDIGYDVIAYRGYFGHWYYSPLKPLHYLEFWKTRALVAVPNPLLCSYSVVILRNSPGAARPCANSAVSREVVLTALKRRSRNVIRSLMKNSHSLSSRCRSTSAKRCWPMPENERDVAGDCDRP